MKKRKKVYLIGNDPVKMKKVEDELIKEYDVVNHFNFKEIFEGEFEKNPKIKNKMRFIELLSSDFYFLVNQSVCKLCENELSLVLNSGIEDFLDKLYDPN